MSSGIGRVDQYTPWNDNQITWPNRQLIAWNQSNNHGQALADMSNRIAHDSKDDVSFNPMAEASFCRARIGGGQGLIRYTRETFDWKEKKNGLAQSKRARPRARAIVFLTLG